VLPNDIGYMSVQLMYEQILPKFFLKHKNSKGIILDLRNYPRDFQVVYKLSEYLMPHPTPFVKFARPSIGCPGMYSFDASLKVGKERTDYYKGLVVILVNEFTQSRAEFFAMAFRKAPKALVIGSQTAGADGDMTVFPLPGGYQTGITGAGVYYPDGTETQRIGIVPDIEVTPTIKGIQEGKDEVLEKAIDYIKKQ
jgi:C-terminal processing protease CtpA/Prc